VSTSLINSVARRGFSNNDNVNVTPYFVFPATPSWFDFRQRDGAYPRNPFTASNPVETFTLSRTPRGVAPPRLGERRLLGAHRRPADAGARLTGGIDNFSQQNNIVTPRGLQFEPTTGSRHGHAAQRDEHVRQRRRGAHHVLQLGGGNQLTTSAGTQYEFRQQRASGILGRDVVAGRRTIQNASVINADDFRLRQIDQAFYLQEEFLGLNERLLLTAAVRAQRSTVNGDQDKYYVFPKLAGSFRLAGLPAFVSEAKVRVAFGAAGNPPLTTAQFSPLITGVYGGNTAIQLGARLGNPNIRPEIQRGSRGGVDLAFFNQRASLALTATTGR
jgi:hypothetical protein